MNPIRRIAEDLVEKRLWPIALFLVIALVAVPLLVGGGSAGPAEELAATPAVGAVESAAPTVALVGPPAVRSRPGKLRDPFRRTKKKAQPAAPRSGSSGSSGSSSGSSPKQTSSKADASTGGASTTPPGTKTKSTSPAPKVLTPTNVPSLASRSVYETVARFTGARHDYEHPLDRLAVLGTKASPALLYLGVSRGGEYAVFLLGPDATAGGDDGACIVADTCRAIGLRKGDKLEVEVAKADGSALHYTLELKSLRRIARTTRSAAHRERQRTAKGGRAALHAFAEDAETAATLGQLRYGPLTGTVALVRTP
jgi:hypothetical protein